MATCGIGKHASLRRTKTQSKAVLAVPLGKFSKQAAEPSSDLPPISTRAMRWGWVPRLNLSSSEIALGVGLSSSDPVYDDKFSSKVGVHRDDKSVPGLVIPPAVLRTVICVTESFDRFWNADGKTGSFVARRDS
jgi:hypothetical protein